MRELSDQPPKVEATDPDEAVADLPTTLDEYYQGQSAGPETLPPGLDGALRAIFEDLGAPEDGTTDAQRQPAARLIRRMKNELAAVVFRWTGHFPERTRPLVEHLAQRAEALRQVYPADREENVVVAITSLVTALSMNFVVRGTYFASAHDAKSD
jgi:hypothetical protein